MATRLHVAASHGAEIDPFRSLFAEALSVEPDQLDIETSGPWCVLVASVWNVNAATLDGCLAKLEGPSLRITSEDDARFHLHVFSRDEGTTHRVLEHSLVTERWGRDEEDDGVDGEDMEEWVDLWTEVFQEAMPIPAPLRERLMTMPEPRALEVLIEWQTENVLDALRQGGIDHDRDQVARTLRGENLEAHERCAGLCNLPRFLVDLGMPTFQAWIEEWRCEFEEENARMERLASEERDRTRELLLEKRSRGSALAGGTVVLPTENLHHLTRLAWFLDASARCTLILELPADFDDTTLGERFLPFHEEGHFGGNPWFLDARVAEFELAETRRPLLHALARVPMGSTLDLLTFQDDPEDGADQRYRATRTSDGWRVDVTWPNLTAEALENALELAASAEGEVPFLARDEDELAAWWKHIEIESRFETRKPDREGLSLTCPAHLRIYLARTVFLHRFDGPWDTNSVLRSDFEQEEDLHELFARFQSMPSGGRLDPSKTVWKGTVSTYFETAAESPPANDETSDRVREAMSSLGLLPLGAFVADRFDDVVVNGFACAGSPRYGVFLDGAFGRRVVEFVTRFQDGTWWTTSTNAWLGLDPEAGLHGASHPDLIEDIPALARRHDAAVEAHLERRTTAPVPVEPTRLGLARSLDAFLAQQGFAMDGPADRP